MDVHGKNPASEAGRHIRRSVWTWRPLADFCLAAAPMLVSKIKYLHSNDGDGLGAADSAALASILREHVRRGEAQSYVEARNARLAALPDESCWLCKGTGGRQPPPTRGPGSEPCNACGSTGRLRPVETHYYLSVDSIAEFADFLADCGGFEIW